MPPNYCEKCGVEGIPDPQAKNRWECPRCHGKLIHVEANNSLIIRDAFGMCQATPKLTPQATLKLTPS